MDEAYWMLEDMVEYDKWNWDCSMTNYGWEDNYNNVEPSFDTYPHENSSSIESLLRDAIATNDAILQSQETLLRSLENQVGQLVNVLNNHPQGSFLNDRENPRQEGKESWKEFDMPMDEPKQQPEPPLIQEEESNKDEVGDLKLKIFAAKQDATAMLQQCKAEQQNEKSAINVLNSILTNEVNQYFTIEAGARAEVFESQPIVSPVMQEYMYEDPMWPPTPPRALTSYLGVHHAHAFEIKPS
ncbi:hypothetical protein L484_010305 [Morus notabilis]|uniref:Uncharacterized protein n=1 Tax=Morus notabilis TaxID=981085 RepID=W9QYJ5_9ROSA|nr:hypothetical protein L484_010305 [Morus notabilis]